MAWKTHYVGNLRAVNNNFLDTYQLKSQNVILDAHIDQIRAKGDGYEVDITYTHATAPNRDGAWYYHNDVPTDYVRDHPLDGEATYYTMVLDYGDTTLINDPFNVFRNPNPAAAAEAYYLHPIIHYYTAEGNLLDELHLIEDLENIYSDEKHIDVITQFLKDTFEIRK
jgi:hypothetical protein